MKKFLLVTLALLASGVIFLGYLGYSRIEVTGYTREAATVTVTETYWSLGQDADVREHEAILLALRETEMREMFNKPEILLGRIKHQSGVWTLTSNVTPPQTP